MTPEQMTPAQKRRQSDVNDLARSTAHVYKPKGAVLVVMIDTPTEVYAAIRGMKGADPLDLVPVLRALADDVEQNVEAYRGQDGSRVREFG